MSKSSFNPANKPFEADKGSGTSAKPLVWENIQKSKDSEVPSNKKVEEVLLSECLSGIEDLAPCQRTAKSQKKEDNE